MHRGARFGIPATKLGTIYTIEECRFLFSVVGLANAKRILYGSELFDAAAAREMGFADAVVDGDVVESAIAFGAPMSANAPLAIAGTKRILQALATGDVETQRPEIEAADPPGARQRRLSRGRRGVSRKAPGAVYRALAD